MHQAPEELHFQFPHLSLGQIHSALAYYWDHHEEMDRDIARRRTAVDHRQRQTADPPLRARLRALMALALYMDQNVPRAITSGLRLRKVDVLTAFEDGASDMADPELLDRASALGRLLFSHDDDLLAEAARRQAASISFSGVIDAHQLPVSIGTCIDDLALIAAVGEPEDLHQHVLFLPL